MDSYRRTAPRQSATLNPLSASTIHLSPGKVFCMSAEKSYFSVMCWSDTRPPHPFDITRLIMPVVVLSCIVIKYTLKLC